MISENKILEEYYRKRKLNKQDGVLKIENITKEIVITMAVKIILTIRVFE